MMSNCLYILCLANIWNSPELEIAFKQGEVISRSKKCCFNILVFDKDSWLKYRRQKLTVVYVLKYKKTKNQKNKKDKKNPKTKQNKKTNKQNLESKASKV